jgi:hypothetical protein
MTGPCPPSSWTYRIPSQPLHLGVAPYQRIPSRENAPAWPQMPSLGALDGFRNAS